MWTPLWWTVCGVRLWEMGGLTVGPGGTLDKCVAAIEAARKQQRG